MNDISPYLRLPVRSLTEAQKRAAPHEPSWPCRCGIPHPEDVELCLVCGDKQPKLGDSKPDALSELHRFYDGPIPEAERHAATATHRQEDKPMGFDSRELSVLRYANGFTLWHYRSDDDVFADGYFNGADELLRAGDQIIVNKLSDLGAAQTINVAEAVPGSVRLRPRDNPRGSIGGPGI